MTASTLYINVARIRGLMCALPPPAVAADAAAAVRAERLSARAPFSQLVKRRETSDQRSAFAQTERIARPSIPQRSHRESKSGDNGDGSPARSRRCPILYGYAATRMINMRGYVSSFDEVAVFRRQLGFVQEVSPWPPVRSERSAHVRAASVRAQMCACQRPLRIGYGTSEIGALRCRPVCPPNATPFNCTIVRRTGARSCTHTDPSPS